MNTLLTWCKKYFVAIFLVWMAGSGLYFAWHDSMTTDEGVHTASAYVGLTKGEFLFDPEHPFLYKDLTALPLLFMHLNPPKEDAKLWAAAQPTFYDSWAEAREWADTWFYSSGNNADVMMFWARVPGVIILTLFGWLLYYTCKKWFNEKTGRWALFFAAFCPTLLANGHLTDTDIPLAFTLLLSLWALWRYYENTTLKQAVWLGLSLAVALTTKFSAVSLIPITLFWFLYIWLNKKEKFSKLLGHLLLVMLIIWLFIWTLYGWRSPYDPVGAQMGAPLAAIEAGLAVHHLTLTQVSRILRWILPSPYTKGMVLTLGSSYYGRGTFLLGKSYGNGIWWYFPVVFSLKTQLIALALLFAGALMYWKKMINFPKWSPLSWLLGVSTILMLFFSLTSKLDLGIRYLSPLFPMLCIAWALIAVELETRLHWKYFALTIGILYIAPIIWQFNDLLAYTNIMAYPQKDAYLYMTDSNIDWGQQSREIGQVMKDRYHGATLAVNYQWSSHALPYYGVNTVSFDPSNPPKNEVIGINATELAWSQYSYFWGITPDYQIGKEMFFFILK